MQPSVPMPKSGALLSVAAMTAFAFARPASAQCEADSFWAEPQADTSAFGSAVSMSGRRVLVGAMLTDAPPAQSSGTAYVFDYVDGRYVQTGELHPPIPSTNDYFGQAVALDGDVALVGSNDDQMATNAGAGFVYELGPSGWEYAAPLFASDAQLGDYLGTSVDLEGERALLGAPNYGKTPGAAYVYERSGGTWTETAKLTPTDPTGVTQFGVAVALWGDRIAVGARGATDTIFVFELRQGAWTETARIEGQFSLFSARRPMDLEADTIVATHSTVGGGEAYVYELRQGSWHQTATLLPHKTGAFTRFGASIAIGDDRVAVGSVDASSFGSSKTFVEVYARSGSSWASQTVASPGSVGSTTDFFGSSVDLAGDALIVGSKADHGAKLYTGAAYAFTLPAQGASNYCEATANSTGAAASIGLECPSQLYDRMALRAEAVPNTVGLFLYSQSQAQAPFMNGIRCLGGPILRLPLVAATGGMLTYEVDLGEQRADGKLLPGSSWNFQAWFRDSAAGGARSNLSDGLQVTFAD